MSSQSVNTRNVGLGNRTHTTQKCASPSKDSGRVRHARLLQLQLVRLCACSIPNHWMRTMPPTQTEGAAAFADEATGNAPPSSSTSTAALTTGRPPRAHAPARSRRARMAALACPTTLAADSPASSPPPSPPRGRAPGSTLRSGRCPLPPQTPPPPPLSSPPRGERLITRSVLGPSLTRAKRSFCFCFPPPARHL